MEDKPRSNVRYFGMTKTQLTILVVFGLIILGLLGGLAWVISGVGLSNLIPVSPVSTDPATVVPLPTFTLRNTSTPPEPTPTDTPVSYESLIPEGWIQFKVGKAEMWMPATFVKAAPGEDLLAAVEKSTLKKDIPTKITLWKESVPGMDLDTYVNENLKNFPNFSLYLDTTILEKKKFPVDPFEGKRVKVEYIAMGVQAEFAYYILKDGSTFWVITCGTYLSEFPEWQPIFDKVVHTFRVNP
jgi:hypothetical protein